jgi:hypothetical protein
MPSRLTNCMILAYTLHLSHIWQNELARTLERISCTPKAKFEIS